MMFPKLPDRRYQIIYADPPWDYKGQKQHTGPGGRDSGGALSHYHTVKLADLMNLNVSNIADPDSCLLFMWITSPHLDQGIYLLKCWGFSYATIAFVWDKQKTNPGYYTLSQYEICVVGKLGTIPKPRGSRNERQKVSALRTRHSEKPDEVRDRITKMFPEQSKIELFARKSVTGWDSWGNEEGVTKYE